MIIAIDPGVTTGVAWQNGLEIKTAEIIHRNLLDWIRMSKPDLVVIERFSTSNQLSKYGLITIDLIGQVKGYCFACKIPCIEHMPAERKAWLSKAARKSPHERDALAHLYAYLDRK